MILLRSRVVRWSKGGARCLDKIADSIVEPNGHLFWTVFGEFLSNAETQCFLQQTIPRLDVGLKGIVQLVHDTRWWSVRPVADK